MQGNEVGALQQFAEVDRLGAIHADRLGGQIRVMNDWLHLEGKGPLDHQSADLAGPDHAEGLAGQLDAEETLTFPPAAFGGGAGGGNLPGQGHEQGKGVLGSGGGTAERGVHDHHALAVGGGKIHVVGSHPGPADHLELAGCLEHRRVDQGAAAHHQGVSVGDGGQQLLWRQPRLVIDLEPFSLFENLQPLDGKPVGNENFHRLPPGG